MKKYLLLTLAIGLSRPVLSQELDGSKIFSGNCAACHTIGSGKLLGPDLKGVGDRRDRDWIVRFISNSQQMIQEGDPVAVQLFQENNMIPMASFQFNELEMNALLAYIFEDEVRIKNETLANHEKPGYETKKLSENPSNNESNEKDGVIKYHPSDKLPIDQRDAIRRSMLTGFLIVSIASIFMAIGVYFSLKQ